MTNASTHPWCYPAAGVKPIPAIQKTDGEKIRIATKFLESRGFTVSRGAQLLSRSQLAEYLGCSSAHVDNLTNSGSLPRPMNIGNALSKTPQKRWRLSDIERWLESTTKEAA
jgi:predicted DNA-binding transcriptional regulator AlpA